MSKEIPFDDVVHLGDWVWLHGTTYLGNSPFGGLVVRVYPGKGEFVDLEYGHHRTAHFTLYHVPRWRGDPHSGQPTIWYGKIIRSKYRKPITKLPKDAGKKGLKGHTS